MRWKITGQAAGHKTENESVKESTCGRCGGSAIDPEDSRTGSYGEYYDEPPALEPCRDCVKPDEDEQTKG